jgi:hypothetical protein
MWLILISSFFTDYLFAQDKKEFWIGINVNRSYATSGDYYGLMVGTNLERTTRRNGVIGLEIGYNVHSEVANELFWPDSRNPGQ